MAGGMFSPNRRSPSEEIAKEQSNSNYVASNLKEENHKDFPT